MIFVVFSFALLFVITPCYKAIHHCALLQGCSPLRLVVWSACHCTLLLAIVSCRFVFLFLPYYLCLVVLTCCSPLCLTVLPCSLCLVACHCALLFAIMPCCSLVLFTATCYSPWCLVAKHTLLFTITPCYSPLHFATCCALMFTFLFKYLLPPPPLLLHCLAVCCTFFLPHLVVHYCTLLLTIAFCFLSCLVIYLLCWLVFPPHSFVQMEELGTTST